MKTLKGDTIDLRALEESDLEFLYDIENDEDIWTISDTVQPYSRYLLKQYLENSHRDIFAAKQLRLVIANKNDVCLGFIDLFDFDFKNKRAGVGIIIKETKNRNKGYGKEAIEILKSYCYSTLQLRQLYCNIAETNDASLNLFKSLGFEIVGLKRDWNFNYNEFSNEYLLQHINKS